MIVSSSLILSGALALFGLTDVTGIGFRLYFLGSCLLFYILFKLKFKSEKRFKITLLKNFVLLNKTFRKIDRKINYTVDPKNSPLQEKAVKLWKLCLKDQDTNITCSIRNRMRQIEKDNMLIILFPLNTIDYTMTIIDVDTDKSCLYEIRIESKLAESIISSFDIENERRMKMGEDEKRESIYSDLDKLLLQEEKAVYKTDRSLILK